MGFEDFLFEYGEYFMGFIFLLGLKSFGNDIK